MNIFSHLPSIFQPPLKMNLLLLVASAFLIQLSAFAVAPGENLLANGAFATDRTDTPPLFWSMEGETKFIGYHAEGGPEGRPYISIANPADNPSQEETVIRQPNLILVAGERYHLSAWIRTRDFSSANSGVILGNNGWLQSTGFMNFEGTRDWTFMETDITLMDSTNKQYFAAVYAVRFKGELDVADFKVTALTAKAQQDSKVSTLAKLGTALRLVPWTPRLHRIPADNPQLTFKSYGIPPNDLSDVELELSTSDTEETTFVPLQRDLTTIALPKGAHAGTLTATLRSKSENKILFSTTQEFTVIEIKPVSTAGHRRLNNLVTEILNTTLDHESPTQVFTTERDGWVFVAAQLDNSGKFSMALDNSGQIMTESTPRHETFRWIPRGEHVLTFEGEAPRAEVTVRSIAEIFNYCPVTSSFVRENPPYDWEFHVKYGLPAITTQNGGTIPPEHREWFRAQGYRWLGNLNCVNPATPDTMVELLSQIPGMNAPEYDGVTCDEQFFNSPAALYNFTAGLRNYPNPNQRLVYTWIVGKPRTPGIDNDFMAACVDASRGRGKLLIEAYCRTKATEEKAREYFDEYVTETVRQFRKALPDVVDSTGVILGDFNQLPILSLHHHPEVDYKYYLDMQLNLIANAPEFAGLSCVGYWGSYYADHELHRWAYMLLRHYCVEGKNTMLSDEFGFTYLPGHVQNGDFRGTFDGWTVRGDVTLDYCKGLASTSQNRWGGGNGDIGDTFAVFHKTAEEVSTLEQTATKLVPGRTYLLQFITFDADDAHAKRVAGRDIGIRATLGDGAVVRDDLSWHHIDRRETGRYEQNNACVRPNLHHIVFTANAPEVTITLDNALAKPGENLGVNFFSVTPFLLEE